MRFAPALGRPAIAGVNAAFPPLQAISVIEIVCKRRWSVSSIRGRRTLLLEF